MVRRTTLLLPLLLLAGCNGTPLGDQLSRSFSPGSDATAPPRAATLRPGTQGASTTPPPAAGPGTANPSAAGNPAGTPGTAPGADKRSAAAPGAGPPAAGSPTATPTRSSGATTSRTPPPVASPAPYRVTIKLPAADPSAPAEALTQALRSAGLSFEVETIERMPTTAGNRSPAATPAPPTR